MLPTKTRLVCHEGRGFELAFQVLLRGRVVLAAGFCKTRNRYHLRKRFGRLPVSSLPLNSERASYVQRTNRIAVVPKVELR